MLHVVIVTRPFSVSSVALLALSQMAHYMRTCSLAMASRVHVHINSIRHFSFQKGASEKSSMAGFYPTVRHESVDSEKDREGLGCDLGQGHGHCLMG